MKAAAWAVKGLRAVSAPGWRASCVASIVSGALKFTSPRGERVLSNLKLVYPESTEGWRKNIRSRLYGHLGWTVAEILALWRDPAQATHWIDEVRNSEVVEKALGAGKGMLFLSGHYGNWELLAAWYAQYLKKRGAGDFYIVAQGIRDKDLERLIVEFREHSGIRLLDKRTSTLEMVRLLKSGAHIALLADISWMRGVVLPFMGHPCTNTTGPAVLSMLASVPIVPVAIYRQRPFHHAVQFWDPVTVPETEDRRLRIESLTVEVNNAIERFISPCPEQWFWLHNRWK